MVYWYSKTVLIPISFFGYLFLMKINSKLLNYNLNQHAFHASADALQIVFQPYLVLNMLHFILCDICYFMNIFMNYNLMINTAYL